MIYEVIVIFSCFQLHFCLDSGHLASTSTSDQHPVDLTDDLQILKNFDLTLEFGPCTGKLVTTKISNLAMYSI